VQLETRITLVFLVASIPHEFTMSSSHFPFLLILLLIEGILTSNREHGIHAFVPSVFLCCVALTTKQISCLRHFGIQLSVSFFWLCSCFLCLVEPFITLSDVCRQTECRNLITVTNRKGQDTPIY